MNEQNFLNLLEKTLLAEEPLMMDEPFPEGLLDSTGKALILMDLEDIIGKDPSKEIFMACKTPRDLYVLVSNLMENPQ